MSDGQIVIFRTTEALALLRAITALKSSGDEVLYHDHSTINNALKNGFSIVPGEGDNTFKLVPKKWAEDVINNVCARYLVKERSSE